MFQIFRISTCGLHPALHRRFPHRCEEFYFTATEEEFQTLEEIERRSGDQLSSIVDMRRRPDHQLDDENMYRVSQKKVGLVFRGHFWPLNGQK